MSSRFWSFESDLAHRPSRFETVLRQFAKSVGLAFIDDVGTSTPRYAFVGVEDRPSKSSGSNVPLSVRRELVKKRSP